MPDEWKMPNIRRTVVPYIYNLVQFGEAQLQRVRTGPFYGLGNSLVLIAMLGRIYGGVEVVSSLARIAESVQRRQQSHWAFAAALSNAFAGAISLSRSSRDRVRTRPVP